MPKAKPSDEQASDEARFTRGPWRWEVDHSWNPPEIDALRGVDGARVLDTRMNDLYAEIVVSEPDAHLIAAAPDLYEACELALSKLMDRSDETTLVLSAALARARGES